MNKAIFLDRDGVINNPKKNYYVFKIEDFSLNTGVIESLQALQDKDYMLIIITNQGGISKGKYTKSDVDILHAHMEKELELHGVYLSDIYYCPHHTKKENCLCRKPKPLMLEKAMAQLDIDPEQSWFIGDKKSDIEAGESAGVNTIKIRKNQDLRKFLNQIP
ncbi:MAG: HAD family hydrolase [Bacteroidales bacterium]|jgi:D-glycero-D-manno-heptose 1,7-bisphosphate phosphatase|nr:HAD family hydrolase [Bacteroidales bacterium]